MWHQSAINVYRLTKVCLGLHFVIRFDDPKILKHVAITIKKWLLHLFKHQAGLEQQEAVSRNGKKRPGHGSTGAKNR